MSISHLQPEDAAHIASLSRDKGRVKLLECLGVKVIQDPDELFRTEIVMDFLYDSLADAVRKGFHWIDVCKAVSISNVLISACCEMSLPEAVQLYQKAAAEANLELRNQEVFTDCIFGSFFRHFKLIQYVLKNPREQLRLYTHQTVFPPVPPQPLRQSRIPDIHQYESLIAEIKARSKPVPELNPNQPIPPVTFGKQLSDVDQAEAINTIIATVVRKIGRPLSDQMQEAITATFDDLQVKLDETALPRPKALGSPPRYHIKAAIAVPKIATDITRTKTAMKNDKT